MTKTTTPTFTVALLTAMLALVACDDSSSDDGSDDTTGGDPYDGAFEGCVPQTLEEDLVVIDGMGQPGPIRWYGPGADPETGELLDDGETRYHVSATYLALRPENIEQFFGLISPLNEALFSNPGLVALQLGDSPTCATARTLTVWSSEDAMYEFVTSQAHIDAIVAFPEISRATAPSPTGGTPPRPRSRGTGRSRSYGRPRPTTDSGSVLPRLTRAYPTGTDSKQSMLVSIRNEEPPVWRSAKKRSSV